MPSTRGDLCCPSMPTQPGCRTVSIIPCGPVAPVTSASPYGPALPGCLVLKVGSRQNLQNRMDVRREFYSQKKNVLATAFECTMHQFHENLN